MAAQFLKYAIPVYAVWLFTHIFFFVRFFFTTFFATMVSFQQNGMELDVSMFSGMAPLIISHILVSILGFAFIIYMAVDCWKRTYAKESTKIIWMLVIIFGSVIGASVYYYVVGMKEAVQVF